MKNRKISDNLVILAETGFTLVLFALLFYAAWNDARHVVLLGFLLTAFSLVYFTARSRWRLKHAIRYMTDEISSLPSDLSDKEYDTVWNDTRVFFEELARVKKLLRHKGQLRQELLEIVNAIASNMEFDVLLQELLPRMLEATRSSCAAFYTINRATNKLEIKHSVGFSKNIYSEFDLTLGEGFVGLAAASKDITIYNDIPDDTVYFIRTFLGKIKPRSVVVVPVMSQEHLAGTMVCASIYEYSREDIRMIEFVKHYLGMAVKNGENFERTKRLTNELTFQNKLIQDQHVEMKKRLNEKTKLLNYLINYIGNDCLYAMDENGAVLVWNNGAERLYNIKADTALGKNADRLMEENHWPGVTKQFHFARTNGTHTESFWRPGSDGANRRYEQTLTAMRDEQNRIIGILCLVREVVS